MGKIFFILFAFFTLSVSSQDTGPPAGHTPIKGEGYALRDANGKIIMSESGGVLSIINVKDTAATTLVQPPDTADVFTVNVGGTDEPFSSLLTEIKSYWTLEESSGNAVDSVGTADLPVYGNVTREQSGKIGDCYAFATNGYLGNIDTYYELDQFSVAFWMKVPAVSAYTGLIGCNNRVGGGTYYGWDITLSNTGKVFFYMRQPATINISSAVDYDDDSWHHVVGTFADDDTMKLYVDGVLRDKDYSTGPYYHVDSRFIIGARNLESFLTGSIDEPAIWNKELTQKEIDSLFAEKQYPFIGQGSGGDSLRQTISGYDTRVDTLRVIWNYQGDGKATDEDDGNDLFAFNVSEISEYVDTTFPWPFKKDTTVIFTLCSGLDPEDIWVLQHDTVFIDSSDISPPPQDYPGVWDTIWYEDFEQHTDAPIEYTNALWDSDWPNSEDGYRFSDNRWPGWWAGQLPDSIVVDGLITSSKVLKLSFEDTIADGYDGQIHRGGDSWNTPVGLAPVDQPKEFYFSYNIMWRPGLDMTNAGKLPGIVGGSELAGGQPDYGEGFKIMMMFNWNPPRSIIWYNFHHDPPNPNYPDMSYWDDFQPAGLDYDEATGAFLFSGTGATISNTPVWYNITIRVVCNTFTGSTPNYDGIVEGYVNGKLIDQIGGLYLLTYPDEDKGLNYLRMAMFWGGGGPPLRDEWIYYDDFCVFTYDESVDVTRGNELSPPGRVLNLPGDHKWEY